MRERHFPQCYEMCSHLWRVLLDIDVSSFPEVAATEGRR